MRIQQVASTYADLMEWAIYIALHLQFSLTICTIYFFSIETSKHVRVIVWKSTRVVIPSAPTSVQHHDVIQRRLWAK